MKYLTTLLLCVIAFAARGADDLQFIPAIQSSPESVVKAPSGKLIVDEKHGKLYIKQSTPDLNTGWLDLTGSGGGGSGGSGPWIQESNEVTLTNTANVVSIEGVDTNAFGGEDDIYVTSTTDGSDALGRWKTQVFPDNAVEALQVFDASGNENGFEASAQAGAAEFKMLVGDTTRYDSHPSADDGTTPYFLDTSIAHTSGNLFEVRNHSTNKLAVAWDGKVVMTGNGDVDFLNFYSADANHFVIDTQGSAQAQNLDFKTRNGSLALEITDGPNLRIGYQASDITVGDNGLSFNGVMVNESSDLPIIAAGNQISATRRWIRLTPTSPITLTSTPTIDAATTQDGQDIYLLGSDNTNTLTVNDESTTAGSKLQLSAASRTLGKGDILHLHYVAADGFWYEAGFNNN